MNEAQRTEPNRTEPKPHLELTYQSQNVPKTHTQKKRERETETEKGREAKGIYIDTRQGIAAGRQQEDGGWRGMGTRAGQVTDHSLTSSPS